MADQFDTNRNEVVIINVNKLFQSNISRFLEVRIVLTHANAVKPPLNRLDLIEINSVGSANVEQKC